MGLQERVEIHPKGGNPDRRYYVDGGYFIKRDSDVDRGKNEVKMMGYALGVGCKFLPTICSGGIIEGGWHEIGMEHIGGNTLEEITFTANGVWSVAQQLYRIAADLMRARIIHGDINVSNVMVRDNGELALIDWEMARPMEPGQELYDMVAAPWGIVKTINMIKVVA